ncbi:MAG: hypothetical protein WEB88_03875 [Gemmatimonadota bacterium]
MVKRRKWRQRNTRETTRRMTAGARAEPGEGADQPQPPKRVPVLGPYEMRYDVADGYGQAREIEVR